MWTHKHANTSHWGFTRVVRIWISTTLAVMSLLISNKHWHVQITDSVLVSSQPHGAVANLLPPSAETPTFNPFIDTLINRTNYTLLDAFAMLLKLLGLDKEKKTLIFPFHTPTFTPSFVSQLLCTVWTSPYLVCVEWGEVQASSFYEMLQQQPFLSSICEFVNIFKQILECSYEIQGLRSSAHKWILLIHTKLQQF